MNTDPFAALTPQQREAANAALSAVMGDLPVEALTPVSGGASGAAIFRVAAGANAYFLRIEGPDSPLLRRNPHRHACTRLAAEARIAPRLHFLDAATGVSVSDFIERRPLAEFPGGPVALAEALGTLLRGLQDGPAFPTLVHYPDLLVQMLDHVQAANKFAPGELDPHRARLDALRAAGDWDEAHLVASHNDPNLGNILFDGTRLWLIDWEAGYANHPMVDVSIVLDGLAANAEQERALLRAWRRREPDAAMHAELAAVRGMTRLYYACFLLDAASSPDDDVHRLGEAYLHGFLTGEPVPPLIPLV